jgi:hypothetical protein
MLAASLLHSVMIPVDGGRSTWSHRRERQWLARMRVYPTGCTEPGAHSQFYCLLQAGAWVEMRPWLSRDKSSVRSLLGPRLETKPGGALGMRISNNDSWKKNTPHGPGLGRVMADVHANRGSLVSMCRSLTWRAWKRLSTER